MIDADDDVPDSGAAFTFGRSRFANNIPGKFWIRDDPILQVACGDEHSAFLTASGRVFTFGSNEWGQLGHGHTDALSKPSCVKGLKSHRATVVTCGRSHTLIATDTGHVFGFGANSEGQLGSPHEYTIHTSPVRIQGFENVTIKMLSSGADHSIALTDKGAVYVWGSNAEGQIGLEKSQYLSPTELKFASDVMSIAAGYYHSAFVTVDGYLYTCGENESGKLGVSDVDVKKTSIPRLVIGIPSRIVYVACGGNHTVALTANGKAYSFGNGFSGQLGIGDRTLETSSPRPVSFSENVKVARVSCGENHTAFLTDSGHLYTCGDRRHGKVGFAEDDEELLNQFFPTVVRRFQNFQVQQVSCGGCHMLVLAIRRKIPSSMSTISRDACPTRKREVIKKTKLPPLEHRGSDVEFKKNTGSVQSLKNCTRTRLPSITKSPVWYVPLERVVDASKDSETNSDDEVLSKLEQRCSLLDELEEDESIRHVDSDVESDVSEISELNKTHTLIRIDNTISIVRPVITDETEVMDKNILTMDSSLNQNMENEDNLKTCSEGMPQMCQTSSVEKGKMMGEVKTSQIKNETRKSLFYDVDENGDKRSSSSSTLSKSSKACILL